MPIPLHIIRLKGAKSYDADASSVLNQCFIIQLLCASNLHEIVKHYKDNYDTSRDVTYFMPFTLLILPAVL